MVAPGKQLANKLEADAAGGPDDEVRLRHACVRLTLVKGNGNGKRGLKNAARKKDTETSDENTKSVSGV